jgi:hypothetical protein
MAAPAAAPRQHAGQITQHIVAHVMAVIVVDRFEVVDVHDHQAQGPPCPVAHRLGQQAATVEQPGQRIDIGQPFGQPFAVAGIVALIGQDLDPHADGQRKAGRSPPWSAARNGRSADCGGWRR